MSCDVKGTGEMSTTIRARSSALGLRSASVRTFLSGHVAAGYGIIGRLWTVVTGPVTILLLTSVFTPVLQGFFFTFLSLIAIRTLAEMGLGQVIIVRIARASVDGAGDKYGEPEGRIRGITRFAARWFAGAGAVVGLVLSTAGTAFLYSRSADLSLEEWLLPWLALCVLVAFDIAITGFLFVLEGAGFVRNVYFCRMVRNILNSIILWVCVFADTQLWCMSLALAVSVAWTVCFITRVGGRFVAMLFQKRAERDLDWRTDILPSQWRLAVSNISEYAIVFTLTPIVYYLYGPVLAGQVGVTWQLAASVTATAGSVVAAKFPEFSRLVAAGAIWELDRLTISTAITSILLCFIGAVALGLGVLFLDVEGYALASRLMPLSWTIILLVGVLIWHLNLPIVSYLRAHGGDPFLPVNLAGAALMLLSEGTLGRWIGPQGIVLGYTIIGAVIMVPSGVYLLYRQRILRGYVQNRLQAG
jgi:hypothetical protein